MIEIFDKIITYIQVKMSMTMTSCIEAYDTICWCDFDNIWSWTFDSW